MIQCVFVYLFMILLELLLLIVYFVLQIDFIDYHLYQRSPTFFAPWPGFREYSIFIDWWMGVGGGDCPAEESLTLLDPSLAVGDL